MPRRIIVDKTTFTNPSLPTEYKKELTDAQISTAESPEKINFSILKYYISKSLQWLITQDIDLLELSPEERDLLYDDVLKVCCRKLFSLIFKLRKNRGRNIPFGTAIESIFYIFKYDRLCAKESSNMDDEASVSIYINKYGNEKVVSSIIRNKIFYPVEKILYDDLNSDNFEKKIFSAIVLRTELREKSLSDSFCKELYKSFSKQTKDDFNNYRKDILGLMDDCFEEYKDSVLNGEL